MDREGTGRLLMKARGLALLRGVLRSPAAEAFLALLDLLAAAEPDPVEVAETFGRLWEELAVEPDPLLPDAWQSHLAGRLLDDENPFSLAAERGSLGDALLRQARLDLRTLQGLFSFEAETLLRAVEESVPGLEGVWVPWTDPGRMDGASDGGTDGDTGGALSRGSVARALASATDWGECAGLLADRFARHGAGPFGRYRALRWRGGGLRAVPRPDPVGLDGLVGYERERGPLVRNTERFLAGLPAHHALLYGPPGTGKSSTVKAVAREYAGRGLRLVEVAKEDLGALPRVLEKLRGRAPRFVLFVDDLSFEEHEVEYKALKALLEGSVEEPPENVRVYATSNRRNLVREDFADRGTAPGTAPDDVHAQDTAREKVSLVARFGLRLTFPDADQKAYLGIVSGLARARGLGIPEEDLARRAVLWDRWHAGRSGRTARQFVDDLEAELAEQPRSPTADG